MKGGKKISLQWLTEWIIQKCGKVRKPNKAEDDACSLTNTVSLAHKS